MALLRNLIEGCRLSSARRKEPCSFLVALLGYVPANPALYEQALTHKSVSRRSNERLEFLGDAVIGLVAAEVVYRLYPDRKEGVLSQYRSRLVCRSRLNAIARRMGLAEHLRIGTPLRQNAGDVYGNALEAFVGAVYEEGGYARAEAFVRKYIIGNEAMLKHELEDKKTDYKSLLLEWGQHRHCKVVFTQLSEHYDVLTDVHRFVVQVEVDGKCVQGGGYTKREAQQTASKKMLGILNK